jgi:hypothetical protein
VRFWDTSALLPLVIAEPTSRRVRGWLAEDPDVVVWTLTRVELLSALARRLREAPGSARELRGAPCGPPMPCSSAPPWWPPAASRAGSRS